jgi:hypothetical protein
MLINGNSSDTLYQYTLSTGFDLSTASYDSVSFSIAGQDSNPKPFTFNTDGTKMYVVGDTFNSVFQYSTGTSFTAGQQYFVQTDGTLGLTAADPSVIAGTAISATEIIVKG